MAKHRNNPNMPFWKMIKEGYDHFEVTKQEPKVDFCEKKYVFDAVKSPDAKRDPVFEASAKCPAYVIPDEVADAVRQKQREEEAETAKLIAKGTPVARMNTGIDGGMNRVFAAHIPDGNTGLSDGGSDKGLQLAFSSPQRAPGTIPAGVNPPRGQVTSPDEPLLASTSSTTRVASAAPSSSQSDEGFFSSLARKVGLGSATADTTATAAPAPAAPSAKPKPPRPEGSIPKTAATAPKTDTKQAAAHPPLKPAVADTAAAPAPAAPAAGNSLVAGAQPIVSANSFDSRFSAAK
jgi:hypothetical protein